MDVTPRTLTEVPAGGDQPSGPAAGTVGAVADPHTGTTGPTTAEASVTAGGAGRRAGRTGRGGRGGGERRFGRARGWVLGLVAVAALGFVAFRGLGNATLFFYNADEAVAKKAELGEDRFRLQGNVVEDQVDRADGVARFTVTFAGVDVPVRHVGEIPKLFQPGIPVVLEGRWDGDVFASDRMLVKHSEVYVEQNPTRVKDYDEGTLAGQP